MSHSGAGRRGWHAAFAALRRQLGDGLHHRPLPLPRPRSLPHPPPAPCPLQLRPLLQAMRDGTDGTESCDDCVEGYMPDTGNKACVAEVPHCTGYSGVNGTWVCNYCKASLGSCAVLPGRVRPLAGREAGIPRHSRCQPLTQLPPAPHQQCAQSLPCSVSPLPALPPPKWFRMGGCWTATPPHAWPAPSSTAALPSHAGKAVLLGL